MTEQNPLPPEKVYDTRDEMPERQHWTPMRVFTAIVAMLFIFSGLLWVAETIGLMAAVLPGGPSLARGFLWGLAGLVGLVLLLLVVFSGRPGDRSRKDRWIKEE